MNEALLHEIAAEQPYPLLFLTISGAHLYGFPSPDSDYDVRGAHIVPVREAIGFLPMRETIRVEETRDGVLIDLETHDLLKYFTLLTNKNGNLLEQIFSPLVVATSPGHERLKSVVVPYISRHHAHHYLGLSKNQWDLFNKETPRRVKPLLYVYRALLTGIHLMRSGEVEANLVRLNELYPLPYIPELIERKLKGAEQGTLESDHIGFHQNEYGRLRALLEQAQIDSHLPDAVPGREALHDLLVAVRMGEL